MTSFVTCLFLILSYLGVETQGMQPADSIDADAIHIVAHPLQDAGDGCWSSQDSQYKKISNGF